MIDDIQIPQLASKNKSTKDVIISILSQEWPLSAKKIYNKVIREHGLNVSYQAVHKLLLQLLDDKVLEKQENEYSLNKDWIKRVKHSAATLDLHYSGKIGINELKDLHKKDVANLTFIGILELARFLIGIYMQYPNPKNKPNICLWRNIYSIVGLKDEDYAELKEVFAKTPYYIFSQEDNLLDRMFADGLKGFGAKHIMFGVECATPLCDTIVIGDYVGQIWYSPDFRHAWYLQNKSPKTITEFNLASHLDRMRDAKPIINMVITRNQVLADQIREEYLKYFEGDKK
ncbi:MAG: hypothetical protein HYW05_03285 [Candidatus Diapherotrites archaeon]|nr:hypothetical protein [Candidatus Diapherotrites archaeon]